MSALSSVRLSEISHLSPNFSVDIHLGVLSASEVTRKIEESFKDVRNQLQSLVSFEDLKSMIEQENFRLLQERLQSFISSNSFQEKLEFWKKHVSIHELRDEEIDEENFADKVVHYRIRYDADSLPIEFLMDYRERPYKHLRCSYDLAAFKESSKRLKGKNLDFLNQDFVSQMLSDVKSLEKKLTLATPQDDRLALIKIFNEKWEGKYRAAYTEADKKGNIVIQDPTENYVMCTFTFTVISLSNRLEASIKELFYSAIT